jgi:reverse gyrase
MEAIRKLVCGDCSNNESFVAVYSYICRINNQGDKLEKEEMYDEPEYQCPECGSYNVHFHDE